LPAVLLLPERTVLLAVLLLSALPERTVLLAVLLLLERKVLLAVLPEMVQLVWVEAPRRLLAWAEATAGASAQEEGCPGCRQRRTFSGPSLHSGGRGAAPQIVAQRIVVVRPTGDRGAAERAANSYGRHRLH
jgi:hypothetical protein